MRDANRLNIFIQSGAYVPELELELELELEVLSSAAATATDTAITATDF